MNFSDALQQLLDLSGVKVGELAQALGYDISYVSKWLAGTKLPSAKNIGELIEKIAEVICGGLDETGRLRVAHFAAGDRLTGLTQELRLFLLQGFYEQRERRAEEKISGKSAVLWSGQELSSGAIGTLVCELCGKAERDVFITVTYPLQEYGTKDCDFFQKLQIADGGRGRIHIDQFVDMSCFSDNLSAYCKCILTYLPEICSVHYGFFPMSHAIAETPLILIKDEMLVVRLREPFAGEEYHLITRDGGTVNAYWRAVSQYAQKHQRMIEERTLYQLYSEKCFHNYIMQSQYRILLHEMYAFALPPDLNQELAGEMGENAELYEYLPGVSSLTGEASLCVVLYRQALMDYIFDGKITVMGQLRVWNQERRVRHLRNLIEQMRSNPKLQLVLLDDQNPFLNYGDLQCSLFFSDAILFAQHYPPSAPTRCFHFRSKELIGYCNQFLQEILCDESCLLSGKKVIDLLERGIKYIT